ncbi:MAG: dienelactone hydrolase family protein [Acetobacteraceae bacterium]
MRFPALGAAMVLAAVMPCTAPPAAFSQTTSTSFAPYVPPGLPVSLAPLQPPPAAIPALLRLPPGTGPVPAVVILHGPAGIDGLGARYAEHLLAAGIGSLEIDMFSPRGIGRGQGLSQRPPRADAMPDVYGALRALASHPRVDAERIGVMGLSYGAGLAVYLATTPPGRAYAAGGQDFRAAAALYPVCYGYDPDHPLARLLGLSFPRLPLLMLVAERDDYDSDGGASCRRLAASGAAAAQARMQVDVLAGATHMWDSESNLTFRDPAARRGQGGQIRVLPNRAATEEGVRRVVTFFQETLGAR